MYISYIKQFSDRIGNVNDQLAQQAGQTPNYGREHRKRNVQQLEALAATITLMACSFTVGALAFAEETIVEVPVEQESIESEKIGLTLILPDSWKDKYAFEQDNDFREHYVYDPAIRKAMSGNSETLLSGGMLF